MHRLVSISLICLASSTALAAAPHAAPPAAPAASVAPAEKPTPTPNPHPRPPVVNDAGFPAPDLRGFDLLPYPSTGLTDASPDIPGKETLVETYQNKSGDRVMKMSLHGVTFAFGVLPGGDAAKGYILLDPKCEHRLTVKLAPDAAFVAPKCAVDSPLPTAPPGVKP